MRREVGLLVKELSSPKEPPELDSSSSSTGRIPCGKVKLRVQREVQLSAVHRSDSRAWSPALALTAVALVLGAVLAGLLSKSKMSPRQRVVLRHHGVRAAVHPGGEVDQPSAAAAAWSAAIGAFVCTGPRRRVAGLQVERIRRTMLLRPACAALLEKAGCHSLQRVALILLLGTAPLCRASYEPGQLQPHHWPCWRVSLQLANMHQWSVKGDGELELGPSAEGDKAEAEAVCPWTQLMAHF